MDPCWCVRATQGRGTCRLRPDRRPRPRRCRLAWLAAQGALWGPGNRRQSNGSGQARLEVVGRLRASRRTGGLGGRRRQPQRRRHARAGQTRPDPPVPLPPPSLRWPARCPPKHTCAGTAGPGRPRDASGGALRRGRSAGPLTRRGGRASDDRVHSVTPIGDDTQTTTATHPGGGTPRYRIGAVPTRGSPPNRPVVCSVPCERLSVCLPPFDTHEANMNMNAASEFAQSIAEAARSVNQPRTLDDTLQTIVEVACNSVPGFDQVGISTLQKEGKVKTRACIGDLVRRLDEIQYGLGEGPCAEALRGIDVVSVSSLRDEQRWPHYVPQARAVGVRSQLAVKLYLDQGTLGGINFYSTVSDDVSPDAQALARLFATHSAIALGHARERANLNEALQSRKMIGQAIGIIMERYDMNEDRAFAFLVRASSHANIKLRAIAQELVDQHNAS